MVLVVAAMVVAVGSARAASDVYKFTIRGSATSVDRANKTVTIYTTQSSAKAQNDLGGETVEFNVTGAKIYKYDKNLKKVRTTLGNVPVQAEVVAKGAKRANGQFNISELTVNPNDFSLVGTVQGHNTGDKTITVQVTSSTYKEKTIKGEDLIIYYGQNTIFRNQGLTQINADELANNRERVKITGVVTSGWKYEGRTLIDGYTKSK